MMPIQFTKTITDANDDNNDDLPLCCRRRRPLLLHASADDDEEEERSSSSSSSLWLGVAAGMRKAKSVDFTKLQQQQRSSCLVSPTRTGCTTEDCRRLASQFSRRAARGSLVGGYVPDSFSSSSRGWFGNPRVC